ncbi:MAG: protein-L-isoaspartate(D-aspartate) O-methyltransferase, partial [Pseudonocardiaceae bacterium]
MPAIPRAWLHQTRIGGLILADLKLSIQAGNLVLLTRLTDRAEGRFDHTWAGFMALRPNAPVTATATVAGQRVARDRARATSRTTELQQLRP